MVRFHIIVTHDCLPAHCHSSRHIISRQCTQANYRWFAGIVNSGDKDAANTSIRSQLPPRWSSEAGGLAAVLETVPGFQQAPAAEVRGMGPVGYQSTSPV